MISRKKIVFTINHLGMGGAENMVIEQIRSIDRGIFQPFLITLLPNPKINLADKIASDVVYVPFNFSGLFDLTSWWKLWKFFRQEEFDVIITYLFNANFIARTVAVFAGIRVILSNECSVYGDKHRWQIIMDRILARFTKKIFVGSTEVLEFTAKQERLPKEKFCLNYNSIPLKLSNIKEKRKEALVGLNLPIDGFYVVTAGRLIKQKGHEYLIDAVKIINERGISNFKVLIFGQGALELELKNKIISLGLESQVKMMGMSTMEKILAISDIFVLPSLWEGLSIALLQAMDSGSPIVATDVSGSREAIVDGASGLLVEPGNFEKLAGALSSLIKDGQLRAKLAGGAIERVKIFSIETNIKTIEREALS